MHKRHLLLAVLLSIITMSSCSADTSRDAAKIATSNGRYASSQSIIEQRYEIACIDSYEDDIYLAGASYEGGAMGDAILLKQEGTEFIPQPIKIPENTRIGNMIALSDNAFIFLVEIRIDDETTHSQLVRVQDGNIDFSSGVFPVTYSKIYPLGNNNIALVNNRGITVVSGQFEEQRKLEPDTTYWQGSCAIGNNVYYLDLGNGDLVSMDAESGEEQNRYVLPEAIVRGASVCADGTSKVFVLSDKGLWSFDILSEEWETSTAREEMPYLATDEIVSMDFCANAQDTIYTCSIVYRDDGHYDYGLTAYNWQEYEDMTTLRVLALRDNMHLRDQMLSYQKAHPDVRIEFIYYLESNDEQQELFTAYSSDLLGALRERNILASDAKEKFNTELLAKGADVIFLDELDYNAYTQYCVDIKDLATTLNNEFFVDIIQCYQKEDGSIPALATRFIVPVLLGAEKEISAIESLADLLRYANNLPSHQLAYTSRYYYLENDYWPFLLIANSAALMDNSSNLLRFTDEMKSALKDMYALSEHQSLHPDLTRKESLANGDIRNYSEWLSTVLQYPPREMVAIRERNENPYIIPMPTVNGAKLFWPKQVAGIYSGSENQEAARSFIEHLLSYEAQSRDDWGEMFTSLPVRRDVLAAFMEAVNTNEEERVYDDRLQANIMELFSSLDTPIFYESTFYLALFENILPYFEEGKTLDEA